MCSVYNMCIHNLKIFCNHLETLLFFSLIFWKEKNLSGFFFLQEAEIQFKMNGKPCQEINNLSS